MLDERGRRALLYRMGFSKRVSEELISVNENCFNIPVQHETYKCPLEDELFIKTWHGYKQEAEIIGLIPVLKKYIVQMKFPIREGISQEKEYKDAVYRGKLPRDGQGLVFQEEEQVRLYIHQTPAGKIPVIFTPNRKDFEQLICVLAYKNEPVKISNSMGALTITLNNWHRIRLYKENWLKDHNNRLKDWRSEFKRLSANKRLYRDTIILLSDSPYSNVPGEKLGFGNTEWKHKSFQIRMEHECTHYFTYRVMGSMKNRLHDEIIADCMGIINATGKYKINWMLNFLGLENYPKYRSGGRLENYRNGLSDEAFIGLQKLAYYAIRNIDVLLQKHPEYLKKDSTIQLIFMLAGMTVEEIAAGFRIHGIGVKTWIGQE